MTLEAIANVAATCTSAIVAGVALLFSYRQNVGWKPIVFVQKSDLVGVPGTGRVAIDLNVELWNRHKYAVIVKTVTLNVSGFEPEGTGKSGTMGYMWAGGYSWLTLDKAVPPADRIVQPLQVEFVPTDMKTLRATLILKVHYFDPLRNKDHRLELVHKFMHPGLGWKEGEGDKHRNQLDESVVKWALRDARETPLT